MKIKRFLSVIVLVLISILALVACSPPPVPAAIQKLVTLSDPLIMLIQTATVLAVGWAFAQIGMLLPWFQKMFGQYADDIAFVISGALIAGIQSWLALIPPGWETVGNLVQALIVAVLAALHIFKLLGRIGVKTFRA